MIKLHNGNCLTIMPILADNSVDSIVTDPPYELGFMGKSWDNTGIAYSVEMWKECFRILKPGGHLLAFGGTRTYHRMAVAIEDAGFEIRDMIEWVYGSGFPKSLNIGKAVDKLQGNEREIIGEKPTLHHGSDENVQKYGFATQGNIDITKGTSAYEGWGTALKPAHEPICMARKPLAEKTVAENCLKYGTGGINIDESRVGTEGARFNGRNVDSDIYGKYGTDKPKEVYDYGRFPANLIHDGSEEVRACFPETKGGGKEVGQGKGKGNHNTSSYDGSGTTTCDYPDSGNASRFFKSIIYTAKASKSDRGNGNAHPTVKPIALMQYLINMVTPNNGTVLDPFLGSGTTGVACVNTNRNFIGIEMDDNYFKIAEKRIKEAGYKLF